MKHADAEHTKSITNVSYSLLLSDLSDHHSQSSSEAVMRSTSATLRPWLCINASSASRASFLTDEFGDKVKLTSQVHPSAASAAAALSASAATFAASAAAALSACSRLLIAFVASRLLLNSICASTTFHRIPTPSFSTRSKCSSTRRSASSDLLDASAYCLSVCSGLSR